VVAGARVSVIVTAPSTLVVIARLVLAVFGYFTVFAVLAGGLYLAGLLLIGSQAGALSMPGLAIASGGALLSVLAVWKWVDHRALIGLGLRRDVAVAQWLRGAAVGMLMMASVVVVWFWLVGGAAWSVNPDPATAAIALILGFVGFVVQGASEEVLFRGYVLENIRAKWGMTWGIGVSALLFSLAHMPNTAFGALPFINLVLFGVATGLWKLRLDAGQLWGVCAIHSMWNWMQQVVFGLPNSGLASPPDETLFSVVPNTSAAAFIWGSGFGPEGTLGATLVLLAVIAATLRVQHPRRR
jgi:uncharacterized protein